MTLFRRPALRRLAHHLGRDRRGAAAVEFALIAPVLLLLLGGLVDGSLFIHANMQVKAAAQTGADYALRAGWDAAGIQTAVTSATPLAAQATPAPVLTSSCVSGQSLVAANGPNCPAGGPAGRFVTVSAQAPFHPIMPFSHLALPSQINARAVVRIP